MCLRESVVTRKGKKKFNRVKEVKRRARLAVGAPPRERVADASEKRRRQAERPKHRRSTAEVVEGAEEN
jgi:hypothetical protein